MPREFGRVEPRRVYLNLLDAHAGRASNVPDVLRDRHESGLWCRHERHIVHERTCGASFHSYRIVEGDELVLRGHAKHSGLVGCALHDPLLGVPARVVIIEEAVAKRSYTTN